MSKDFYLSSPQLFSDLHKININSYGTLCHNSRACQETLSKDLEIKRKVASFVKVKEGTAVYWNEKRKFTSSPICTPPCIKSFYGWRRNTPKPLCIGSYKKSMGFVDVNDMTNSNSISCNMWKWPKKTLLPPILPHYPEHFHKSQIICGETHTHIVPVTTFRGSYPCYTECTSISFNFKIRSAIFTRGLPLSLSNPWPAKDCSWRCNVCSLQGKTSRWFYFCEDSDAGLCIYLTYLLTYSMEHSPSWEAKQFSATQETPRTLWNPKVH